MMSIFGAAFVSAVWFIAGWIVNDIVRYWRALPPKHKCQWHTIYKRVALIDATGVHLERCNECQTERFWTRQFCGRDWNLIETNFRTVETAVLPTVRMTLGGDNR